MSISPKSIQSDLSAVKRIYERALLDRSPEDAQAAITTALGLGSHPLEIYDEVIVPTQVVIGERWHDGQISISEEHIATQLAIEQMNRLRAMIRPKPALNKRVVIGAMTGDSHWLGARIVADHFFYDGWDVDFLGGAPPLTDLRDYVRKAAPELIALSVTIQTEIEAIKRFAADIAKLQSAPHLVIGGKAFSTGLKTSELKGISFASTPREAVAVGRRVCGVLQSEQALNQLLTILGRKVQESRKALRLSQVELAQTAGLDRAYISAIEGGKQNITLEVLMKLSAALEISADELLRMDRYL
jgi:methanogenic corrinoid protein MtbC1/DNA-binding XRE family transcriptional regulator